MKKTTGSGPRAAFTLLELVAVLAILAALAAVAVRQTGTVMQDRRDEISRRGLREIRAAVLGDAPDVRAGGFFADVGRGPRPVREERAGGRAALTLGELLRRPDATAAWDVFQATEENVEGEPDPEVWLGAGWRGPYLFPRDGAETVRDAWGAEYAAWEDPGSAALSRLGLSGEGDAARVVRAWTAGSGMSPTGLADSVSLLPPESWSRVSLVASVSAVDPDGAPLPASLLGDVVLRVWQPNPGGGKPLRCVGSGPSAWDPESGAVAIREDLLPGVRAVRLFTSNPEAPKSAVREVELRPGANLVRFVVRLSGAGEEGGEDGDAGEEGDAGGEDGGGDGGGAQ